MTEPVADDGEWEDGDAVSEGGPAAAPPNIAFKYTVFGMSMHPTEDLVASGLISGEVSIHRYGLEANERVLRLKNYHSESARDVQFSEDGQWLFTVSADMSLTAIDVAAGRRAYSAPHAHEAAINVALAAGPGLLVTGDDDGTVKVWDLRQRRAVQRYEEHDDYVSALAMTPDGRMVLAASGDGSLSAVHLAKDFVEGLTTPMDDELLSLALIKAGGRVVCGTQDGVLASFTYGLWEEPIDRFTGHPKSVDALVALDRDTVFTGSSDGIIRVVSLQPNRLLGVIGDHQDLPIEELALTRDSRYLASSSHDNCIAFWSVGYLFERDADAADADDVTANAHVDESGASSTSTSTTTAGQGARDDMDDAEHAATSRPSKSRRAFFDGLR